MATATAADRLHKAHANEYFRFERECEQKSLVAVVAAEGRPAEAVAAAPEVAAEAADRRVAAQKACQAKSQKSMHRQKVVNEMLSNASILANAVHQMA